MSHVLNDVIYNLMIEKKTSMNL